MKITAFGANGNIGARVVSLLLQEGHTVTAFVHGRSNFSQDPNLKVVQGDIYSKVDIEQVLKDADVVVSTLGSWGTKNKDILTEGMKNIVPAMEAKSIKRIVSLTGAGVLLPGDTLSWYDYLNPLLIKLAAPKILRDGEDHIKLLAKSSLDWTVVRSPIMKNGSVKGYQLQEHPPLLWKRICRDDVARAIVDLALSSKYSKDAPFIQ